MNHPKLKIFASGSKEGGGSGAEKLEEARQDGVLQADIVAFISNHEHGGVRVRADRLGIPFLYFSKPWDARSYEQFAKPYEWVALSGWLKFVYIRHIGFWWNVLHFFGFNHGLDPRRTFNIHPAALSIDHGRFGGPGLYGHHVHEAVKAALDAGEITYSGVTMHFVTNEYDRGPVFFEIRVSLRPGMTSDEIGKAVNAVEHEWQPRITNMVIHGEISWDGKDTKSLKVPAGYEWLPSSK